MVSRIFLTSSNYWRISPDDGNLSPPVRQAWDAALAADTEGAGSESVAAVL
jgi:hypothetical protein